MKMMMLIARREARTRRETKTATDLIIIYFNFILNGQPTHLRHLRAMGGGYSVF
jgi:hypothetical protein